MLLKNSEKKSSVGNKLILRSSGKMACSAGFHLHITGDKRFLEIVSVNLEHCGHENPEVCMIRTSINTIKTPMLIWKLDNIII